MSRCGRPPRGWVCPSGAHTGTCPATPAWWNLWGWYWGRTWSHK